MLAAPFFCLLAYYAPYLSDDALISLRYADRLVDGHGLTWNEGYRVEGYSNLAWVLLAAALHALGADPIFAVRLLGLALMLAPALWLVRRGLMRTAFAAAVLALTYAAHGVAIWAIGGLEQPLVFAALSLGALQLVSWWEGGRRQDARLWAAGAWLSVLVLTRPDAPLFLALAGLLPLLPGAPWARRATALAKLVLLPVAAGLAQLVHRLVYFEAWVPNTARVKLGFSVERWLEGLQYVGLGALSLSPILVLCLLVAGRDWRVLPAPFWVFLGMCVAWLAYVSSVGGDIFPGFRHYIPVLALCLAMVAAAARAPTLSALDGALSPRPLLLAALVGAFALAQFAMPAFQRGKDERWVWVCKDLAEDLKSTYGARDPLIAVTAAGCLPYWTGFEAVDLLGLNDLELPERKPASFGQGQQAHELGDLDYLLARAPDLVVFHIGLPPKFAYAEQIAQDDRFHTAYCAVPTRFATEGSGRIDGRIYVRRTFDRGACRTDAEDLSPE